MHFRIGNFLANPTFSEQETFEDDISYYFPCGKIEPPGSEWLASKGSALGALIGSALIGSTLAAAAPGAEPGGHLRPNGPISERKTSENGGELGPNLFRPSIDHGPRHESTQAALKTKRVNNWMNKIKKSRKLKYGNSLKANEDRLIVTFEQS